MNTPHAIGREPANHELFPVGEAAQLTDQNCRKLYEYWDRKRGSRPAPGPREIDPREIPELLGFINLIEVWPKPRDYRIRLNGSRVAAVLGRDITGVWCSQIPPNERRDRLVAGCGLCADTWTPVILENDLTSLDKEFFAETALLLPLSTDGRSVDMIVSIHTYHVTAGEMPESYRRLRTV